MELPIIRRKQSAPRGYIVWRGMSPLAADVPLVCVMVVNSDNAKTGDMVQTYIFHASDSPLDSMRTARAGTGIGDAAYCGNCPHRHALGGACYVNLGHGPRATHDAYMRGRYPDLSNDPATRRTVFREYLRGRMLRIGTYGDPTCVPITVWREMLRYTIGHTGYTHQWYRPRFQEYSDIVMASVDSEAQAQAARRIGWRYFRVRASVDAPIGQETVCPASLESGKAAQCADCGLCAGMSTPHARSIVIVNHGFKAPRAITRKSAQHAQQRAVRMATV